MAWVKVKLQNTSDDLADQIKVLREINQLLGKTLDEVWENRAFLPIKLREKIKFALSRARS